MNFLKELRVRWMYWRFRNITRNRQRLAARWSLRRSPRPIYSVPSNRGSRPSAGGRSSRSARSWTLLVASVIAISVIQHYGNGQDIVFIADIAVLAAAYLIWVQLDR